MSQDGDQPNARDRQRIWQGIGKALGADPREHRVIRGQSGLDHPVQAIAVDDKHSRVIIISAEPNPRVAALMQVDVQASMPDTKVLVARPIVFDLGVLARQIFPTEAAATVDVKKFTRTMERLDKQKSASKASRKTQLQFERALQPIANAFANATLPALSQIVGVLQQFSYMDWPAIIASWEADKTNPVISFEALRAIDNLAIDREHGVCPIPLYEFSEADWELFASGVRIEDIQARLKELDIYQYFYPPSDQLAIGLADRGPKTDKALIEHMQTAPILGHPISAAELINNPGSLPQLLAALKDEGYLAEGEIGISVTPKGTTARGKIKFRPYESVLSRILNRIRVDVKASVSPKDFLGG